MTALDHSRRRLSARFGLFLILFLALAAATGCRASADNGSDPADGGTTTPPAGSCVDSCGEQSADGCACDSACGDRDDCCADYADECESNLSDSCLGNCDGTAPSGCACDDACVGRDDCCSDKQEHCPIDATCEGRCGGQAPEGCRCDDECSNRGDCCDDKDTFCAIPDDSCRTRCGLDMATPGGCWCDDECSTFGNCCADKVEVCDTPAPTCQGRCGGQDPSGCGCDDECTTRGDCCLDKEIFCSGPPPDDPWAGMSGAALVSALKMYTTMGHAGKDYAGARNHMYGITTPYTDVHDGVIECIYTGRTAVPDGSRVPPTGDPAPNDALNTEHSWPQSQGAGDLPAQGDLHHLFPTTQISNNRRSSYDFGETTCTGAACSFFDGGSELGTDGGGRTVFQVRNKYRGDISRAHFYFSVRYSLSIPAAEEAVLQMWNDQDPPDQRERDRNTVIQSIQGNRNPFVDYPNLSDRISDF